MNNKRQKKKRLNSVVGITLHDGELRAALVTRAKGGIEVLKTATAALTLDILHPEAELVGREIRNHLEAAGIREKRCVVAIPVRWVMSQHTRIPELSPEDTESFLQIEAEKGFPVDPGQLQIARSFQRAAGAVYVSQLAVRKEQLAQLATVLKSAGLKPVSLTPALPLLQEVRATGGRLVVAVNPSGVTLLVSAGGGLAAFRTSESSIDTEAGEKLVNAAAVARELRITFEQVPAELRSEVRELLLTGDTTMVRQLAEALGDWARAAGLAIVRGDLPEKHLSAELAAALGTRRLEDDAIELEFLPPRPGRWALLMARYNARRLATAGFAVGAAALVALAAFGWHEYRRWSLGNQWARMRVQVTGLEAVRANIREYRPWYDTTFRSLSILKRVTECFPETGNVTAKTFEVHTNSNVTISGTMRDSASLLLVQNQLRKVKEVTALKIEQIRGTQFTMTFHWTDNSGT